MSFVSLFCRVTEGGGDSSFAWLTPSRQELTRSNPRRLEGCRSLADLIPPGSAKDAARFRAEGVSWSLVIDKSVTPEIQDQSWESLRIGGVPLESNALVVRDACWRPSDSFEEHELPLGKSGFLNLFPAHEYDFAARLEAHVVNETMAHCYPRFVQEGLDRFNELIVVAHGDENGLLSADGNPFLLETHALPKRIWLLACNVDGAMYRLARALVNRGVRSVITSTGNVSAIQIADVVNKWFLTRGKQSPEDWIRTRRERDTTSGGLRALTIHGEVCMDRSAVCDWNVRTWGVAADVSTPKIGKSEEDFERAVLALERHERELWPLTREWMLIDALEQAENFDHHRMNILLPRVEACVQSASANFAVANAHYRRGEYLRSAKRIVMGLSQAGTDSESRLNLLALLANVLIDMNLPKSASAALVAEKQIELQDAALDRFYTFQCIDRVSRSAFRDGRLAEAREAMEAKRREAISGAVRGHGASESAAYDGCRELAWLLYFRAWEDKGEGCASAEGHMLARDVIAMTQSKRPESGLGGNDPVGYLLRSLACWLWCTQSHLSTDSRAGIVDALRPWFRQIVDRCGDLDPGPWGFARCYLALAGQLPDDDIVLGIRALERARYFSEAAAFARLASRDDLHDSMLQEFERIRGAVVLELRPLIGLLPGVVEGLSQVGSNPAPI